MTAHRERLALLNREAREWIGDAKCAGMDPELFFPARGEPTNAAKDVCRACPVRFDCLEYALAHRIGDGLWGGATGRERRRILKQRAAARRRELEARAS